MSMLADLRVFLLHRKFWGACVISVTCIFTEAADC